MTSLGKQIRMERIVNRNTRKTVITPMDHGMTLGPIPGLRKVKTTIEEVVKGGANAIVIHKGLVTEGHRKSGNDVGLIVHMSASTGMSMSPNNKTVVCSVEEAVKLGADAVSIHVNLGSTQETTMLNDFGKASRDACEWGMPLLAMVYARGRNVENEFGVDEVTQAARVAAEMGADIVKVSYTGTPESFRKVIAGCCIPVVIAGGNKQESDISILEMVKGAIDAGAAGVSIGRNVFQHNKPVQMMKSISLVTHGIASVNDALNIL